MSNDVAVRKCGASFAYCNGNCTDCGANNTYATNSTDAVSMYSKPDEEDDSLGKPSKEEYEKAKRDKEYAANCLFLSRKRRDDLIDELSRERAHEKLYMEMYEKHRDIIRRYEIYQEIEANNGKV
jgi:hypothetical protein